MYKYLDYLIYIVLIVIVLFLPYKGMYNSFKTFAVILFLLVLLRGQINIKNILNNKIIMALFGFILFTYLSLLWTEGDPSFVGECKANINRFKYYFLLIITIYSIPFTTKQIKSIFFIMALAPLYTIAIYYLNAMGITDVKAAISFNGEDRFLTHYLINNFFILYGAIYFGLVLVDNIIKKNYKIALLAVFATLVYFVSMFIDEHASARLMILVFFMSMLMVPLFYIKKKYLIVVMIVLLVSSVLFVKNSQNMQKGIKTFSTALSEDKYVGSWGHRLGYALVGMQIFQENPVFGRGISDVRERTMVFAKENPKYFIGERERHFHNEHINMLVQVGLVGYALFGLFIVLFLRLPLANTFLHRLKFIFVLSFLLIMFGEHYLSIGQTSSFFALFIALMLLYHKQELLEGETLTKRQDTYAIKSKS